MKKTQNIGLWIFVSAIVFGGCLVLSSLVNTLPEILAINDEKMGLPENPAPVLVHNNPTIPTDNNNNPPAIPLNTIADAYVEDKFEGTSPDFRKLIVSYDTETVYITVILNSGVDRLGGAEYLYMYGTHRDMIRLSSSSYRLERDRGADGHFEEVVHSGSTNRTVPDSISLQVPIEYLPDIAEKRVWLYSMQSKDRIPDTDHLLMPESSP